jgi:hypothetical protein
VACLLRVMALLLPHTAPLPDTHVQRGKVGGLAMVLTATSETQGTRTGDASFSAVRVQALHQVQLLHALASEPASESDVRQRTHNEPR